MAGVDKRGLRPAIRQPASDTVTVGVHGACGNPGFRKPAGPAYRRSAALPGASVASRTIVSVPESLDKTGLAQRAGLGSCP